MVLWWLAVAAGAAELTSGELADTAFVMEQGHLAVHPFTEPWQVGVTDYAELRFSAQSLVYPGPELRGELALVQTENTAVSLELGGQLQWSAGAGAALLVTAEREEGVPGTPSQRFLEAMAADVSQKTYLEGMTVGRVSQRVVGPWWANLSVGYALGGVEGTLVHKIPTTLLADWHPAARTILRAGGSLDMASLTPDRETTWQIDLRWAHAWDRFRVEAGARFVTGTLKDGTIATLEGALDTDLPDVPFIPLPTILCWWRF